MSDVIHIYEEDKLPCYPLSVFMKGVTPSGCALRTSWDHWDGPWMSLRAPSCARGDGSPQVHSHTQCVLEVRAAHSHLQRIRTEASFKI